MSGSKDVIRIILHPDILIALHPFLEDRRVEEHHAQDDEDADGAPEVFDGFLGLFVEQHTMCVVML